MKITLIRHTRVAVASGICYGQADVPVADSFSTEALQVKKSLLNESFDVVYTSPLSRCRLLADFCGFPYAKPDERLKELNFGRWEMQAWNEISDPLLQNWYNDWIHLPAGGAESYLEQYQRVSHLLNELRDSNYSHATLFTHRGVIACASVYANLCSLETSFLTEVDYGSVITIVI
jgi:alpha-ribazole phosphatase